jgi:hypothetical protein
MESWHFDLCEDCLVEIIKSFKYVPNGFREDKSYFIINDYDEHQKIFNRWKETGKWEELYYKTYDELIELASIFKTDYINKLIKERFPNEQLLEEGE